MQMRIDCNEAVKLAADEVREDGGGYGLSFAKCLVLTHVRDIRRNQPDARGAHSARGPSRKYEWQELGVGRRKSANQEKLLPRDAYWNPHIAFAVREPAHFNLGRDPVRKHGNLPGEIFASGHRKEDGHRSLPDDHRAADRGGIVQRIIELGLGFRVERQQRIASPDLVAALHAQA